MLLLLGMDVDSMHWKLEWFLGGDDVKKDEQSKGAATNNTIPHACRKVDPFSAFVRRREVRWRAGSFGYIISYRTQPGSTLKISKNLN